MMALALTFSRHPEFLERPTDRSLFAFTVLKIQASGLQVVRDPEFSGSGVYTQSAVEPSRIQVHYATTPNDHAIDYMRRRIESKSV